MNIVKRLLCPDHLGRLMKWARKSGADIAISSSANPETAKHAVIISARNVHYHHPVVGHTFLCAQGDNSDEAARRFMEKLGLVQYSIDRGPDAGSR